MEPNMAHLIKLLAVIAGVCLLIQPHQLQAADNYKEMQLAGYNQRDSGPEMLDIVKSRGFIAQMFRITSRDGYKLTLYHLVNPLANPDTLYRYPVFMFHGLGGDAAQMLSRSEKWRPRRPQIGRVTVEEGDECLAFMLINNNFDLWMVDARGTNLNNRDLSVDFDLNKARRYWNFTLDDQAQDDLPTAIDFVLRQTQADKLHYIGYSQSTFFMFALLARQPHYQNKLASFNALAPVAYVSNIQGTTLVALTLASMAPDDFHYNFLPQPVIDTLGATMRGACMVKIINPLICEVALRTVSGQSNETSEAPIGFYSTMYKSTSTKVLKHFMQLHNQRRFGMFDYGPSGNMRAYGQPTPPNYDLSNIKLPRIILWRGFKDFLSDPRDQNLLISQLGTALYQDVQLPHYNHVDFLLAKRIISELNFPMVNIILEISNQLASSSSEQILRTSDQLMRIKRVAAEAMADEQPVATSQSKEVGRSIVESSLLKNLMAATAESPLANNQLGQLATNLIQSSLQPLSSIQNQLMARPFNFQR